MRVKIINLTPHAIYLYSDNFLKEILISEGLARVEMEERIIGNINGYQIKNGC